MIAIGGSSALSGGTSSSLGLGLVIEPASSSPKQGFLTFSHSGSVNSGLSLKGSVRIKAMEASKTVTVSETELNTNGHAGNLGIVYFVHLLCFSYWVLIFVVGLVAGKVVGKRGSFFGPVILCGPDDVNRFCF